jgi:hypothetical protein
MRDVALVGMSGVLNAVSAFQEAALAIVVHVDARVARWSAGSIGRIATEAEKKN